MRRTYYDGHQLHEIFLGLRCSKTFNLEKKKFMDRNYITDEMVICSSDKIDFRLFEKLIKQYFSLLPERLSQGIDISLKFQTSVERNY